MLITEESVVIMVPRRCLTMSQCATYTVPPFPLYLPVLREVMFLSG